MFGILTVKLQVQGLDLICIDNPKLNFITRLIDFLQSSNLSDLVAEWKVSLSDRTHTVQFEHGTLSGKRIVWVDGKVYYRYICISISVIQ